MWNYTAFAVCGVLLALASLVPETLLSALACTAMAMTLVWASQPERGLYRGYLLFGVVFTLIAFYWLPSTITLFGGFPAALSVLIFTAFAFVSALQFLFCAWLYCRIRNTALNNLRLALPLAWLTAEFFFPRMFPWQVGHSLAAIPPLAGTAEFFGVYPLSALIIWWGELGFWIYRSLEDKRPRYSWGILAAAASTVLLLFAGNMRNEQVRTQLAAAPKLRVALVQGNVSVAEKGNLRYLDVNIERYRELSRQALGERAEVLLWPESVLNRWMPETVAEVRTTKFDPFPGAVVPMIFGGLSYGIRPEDEVRAIVEAHPELNTPAMIRELSLLKYNSAFGITAAGSIAGRYHKKALMPFGEYLPFAETFPQLKKLSPQTGDFARGKIVDPIEFSVGERRFKAGALICYEDLVPALSRQAASHGANVLVNLTNDAWYGNTAAPFQHHLLALWRSIETRRYLLRVTNTGYTAVVDPFGTTVESLPIFREGYLIADIHLLKHGTVYTEIGDLPVWVLSICTLVLSIFRRRGKRQDEVV